MRSELGTWLRGEREARAWSRAEMARRLIATIRETDAASSPENLRHSIYRWERGLAGISGLHQRLICQVFGITPAEFGPRPADSPKAGHLSQDASTRSEAAARPLRGVRYENEPFAAASGQRPAAFGHLPEGTDRMSDFGSTLEHWMRERGIGVRELHRRSGYSAAYITQLRQGRRNPSADAARDFDDALGAGGRLAARARARVRTGLAGANDDMTAAIELGRRAQASDVGAGTCEQLELAVDDLAVAYPSTAPAALLPRVRAHLGYVTRLLDGRATLGERRRLLASGGWLSLLAATLLIDGHCDDAGAAYLLTAEQLARESGHAELAAWCVETHAWQMLTAGNYRQAVELSRAAQETAPAGSSARIQATAQEGRAWARLGDSRGARKALAAVERLVSPLGSPDHPEHHYVYDPPKARVYVATTLSWVGDKGAERVAREILSELMNPAVEPPRPRRIALAQLDLALTLVTTGELDEATATATAAITSGRLAPVDRPRAREIVTATASRAAPCAGELVEAYRAQFAGGAEAENASSG